MLRFVERVLNETEEKYRNIINVDSKNLNKISNFKKFPKSINFRNVLSKDEFLANMNEFMLIYDNINNVAKNKVITICHNIASTFDDKENYREAICFYTISSYYGNPRSMICLIMIYYQIHLIDLSNYYQNNFNKTIDIFNIVRKGKYEDFMQQVLTDYTNLITILEDFKAANYIINLNK